MKRKQTDENSALAKRFKHSLEEDFYDKKLKQNFNTNLALTDRLNPTNRVNESNYLNERLNNDESVLFGDIPSNNLINTQISSSDLFTSLLENYKEDTAIFSKIDRLSEILHKLNNLNNHFGIILDTEYTNEICSTGLRSFASNDLKYLDELYLANSNLPINKQFNFYIVHSRLEIIKNVKSSKHFYKKTYDSSGNLKPLKCKEISKILILESWYDPNEIVQLSNSMNISFDLINNVISHKNGTINYILKHEHNWHNCSKDETINANESGLTITTNHHRFLLFVIPKRMEFNLFLTLNYRYAIDYLYSHFKNKQHQSLLEYLNMLIENLIRINYMNRETISDEYICKILDVIESIRDVSVAKLFLELIVKRYSERIIRKLINLIQVFDWKKLATSIIESMKPATFENISNICIFIKFLLNENLNELGEACLKELVLPILLQRDKFTKQIDQNPQLILKTLYQIAETIVLFNNSDDYFINYKSLINLISPSLFKQLIDEFLNNTDKFKQSKSIYDLLNIRSKWLLNALRNVPEFSWLMEGRIDGHPQVEEFLRSNESQLVYANKFSGLREAKEFVARYSGLRRGFSAHMVPSGFGRACQVVITKTKEFYQSQVNLYSNLQSEHKLIESKMRLFLV